MLADAEQIGKSKLMRSARVGMSKHQVLEIPRLTTILGQTG
jgi:hypothetical protein